MWLLDMFVMYMHILAIKYIFCSVFGIKFVVDCTVNQHYASEFWRVTKTPTFI